MRRSVSSFRSVPLPEFAVAHASDLAAYGAPRPLRPQTSMYSILHGLKRGERQARFLLPAFDRPVTRRVREVLPERAILDLVVAGVSVSIAMPPRRVRLAVAV